MNGKMPGKPSRRIRAVRLKMLMILMLLLFLALKFLGGESFYAQRRGIQPAQFTAVPVEETIHAGGGMGIVETDTD